MDTISKLCQRAYIIVGILAVMAFAIMFGLDYLTAKHRYNKPLETKIERDTVTLWDTVSHWYPIPVEVKQQKPQYKWLTVATHDTVSHIDSVLVEVPIESRHYHADEYDAYVSGYEPSLDSIFVRQKTEYITERVTVTKPPNKFSFNVSSGCEYRTEDKKAMPYAEVGISIKPKKLGVGIHGGYKYDFGVNKGTPYVDFKLTYDIFTF